MWIHVTKVDEKLYQDGIEVKKISIEGSIVDMVVHGNNTVWLNFK